MRSAYTFLVLAVLTPSACFAQGESSSVPPPSFNGGDIIYEIAPGTVVRIGDQPNDPPLYTLWQRMTARGRGPCTATVCPVVVNGHDVFAPRTRLTVITTVGADPTALSLDDDEYPFGWLRLRLGDKGEEVRELQEMLIKDGAKLSVDGVFGRGTESAIRSVQRRWHIEVDGVAGRRTLFILGVIGARRSVEVASIEAL